MPSVKTNTDQAYACNGENEGHLNPVTKIVSCSDNFCKSSFQKRFHKQWSAELTSQGQVDMTTTQTVVSPRTSEVVQSL